METDRWPMRYAIWTLVAYAIGMALLAIGLIGGTGAP